MEYKQSMLVVVVTLTESMEDMSNEHVPSRVQQAQDQLGEGDDSKLHQDKDDVVDEEHAEVCGPRYQYLKRFSNQPTENQ